MRWSWLLALVLVSCDPQADPSYPGEPLITLQGQVTSGGPLPALEAAMLWQRGDPPSTGDQDLATRAPVQTGFPATFTVHLYHPPPDAARRTLAAGETMYARASAAAIPYGIAASALDSLGGPAIPAGVTPAYGIDPGHWVVWLGGDLKASSLTAWWLGAPLSAGFHLVRVAAVNPSCLTAAQLDACAADLVQRGVPDDGTSNPGTARGFCLAPYRVTPAPPNETLVLDLGAVSLGPPGGACP
jgi:hypothetical protein